MKPTPKVVVTGLGMVSGLGLDLEQSWEKALAGSSGIGPIPYPEARHAPVPSAGAVSPEDWRQIKDRFPEAAATEGERRTLFALWAADRALADAGYQPPPRPQNRYGVALASGLGINRLEDVAGFLKPDKTFDAAAFGRNYQKGHRESLVKNNANRPAALIAQNYGLGGPNLTVTTACASATQALGLASHAIRRGRADLMLAGGADSMLNPIGYVFFVLLGAAATATKNPAQNCRPFDRRRSGLVIGEGAGVAVLESAEHARKRGARIYAEVAGYGSSLDAYQVTAPHPKGAGAAQSMQSALDDAELSAAGIDYINAHGTATKLNDSAETLAIKKVFGPHAAKIAINSSKSLIGHLMAGAGGPEFALTVLSVQRDRVHPTVNLTQADSKCDLDYVPGTSRTMPVRAALSNSFGFGGQNGSIVVRKYE